MNKYPKPYIPTQPILSWPSIKPWRHNQPPSILQTNSVRYVTSGRVAIALALKHMGILENDRVLIPAYHCNSMVEPVIWSKAMPVFYRINPDTSVDLNSVRNLIDSDTKALIVTHYFGFHQDIGSIRELCDQYGIKLIEDCAHAFFGNIDGKPIGTTGDYSIASIMKFFPVYDGGCLCSSINDVSNIDLSSAGSAFQIKAALNSLENAFEYKRLKFLNFTLGPVLKIKDILWKIIKSKHSAQKTRLIGPSSADGGYSFETKWINKKCSITSKFLLFFTSHEQIIQKRRRNYLQLHHAFSKFTQASPLFPTLPDNVVPYVYPLVVENAEIVFPILKNQGVPIIRFGEFLWDGVDATVCPVSYNLSKKVFQFPCHQDLNESEIKWMIEKVEKAINNTEENHGT